MNNRLVPEFINATLEFGLGLTYILIVFLCSEHVHLTTDILHLFNSSFSRQEVPNRIEFALCFVKKLFGLREIFDKLINVVLQLLLVKGTITGVRIRLQAFLNCCIGPILNHFLSIKRHPLADFSIKLLEFLLNLSLEFLKFPSFNVAEELFVNTSN